MTDVIVFLQILNEMNSGMRRYEKVALLSTYFFRKHRSHNSNKIELDMGIQKNRKSMTVL